jgi:hypothetical protein
MKTVKIFKLTKEHLKLLKHLCIEKHDNSYKGYVVACVYPKPPFGNSDIYLDIANILNWNIKNVDGISELFSDQIEYAKKLYNELYIALEICLRTASFKEGIYECQADDSNWKFLEK